MTPAEIAAAEAILNHIAPGQEHTSPHQNVETYADMARSVVQAVTPVIFDSVAELVVHEFPDEFTKESLVDQLRRSAAYRRNQIAAQADRVHDALFGQNETTEGAE